MLSRTAQASLKSAQLRCSRRFATAAVHPPRSSSSSAVLIIASSTALIVAGYTYKRSPLKAESQKNGYESQSQLHSGKLGSISPALFMWGRNTANVVAPHAPDSDIVKRPKLVSHFDGEVLRDVALHSSYGLAVDAKGDVLQWGSGYSDDAESGSPPRTILRNRNIVQVAATDFKIYALSKSGQVYVLPSQPSKQAVGAEKRLSAEAWWKLRWLFGGGNPGTDLELLKADNTLASGEKFSTISAGNDHLLALTSKGRAFATPVTLSANKFGQLGVRRVTLLALHPSALASGAQVALLIPETHLNDLKFAIPPPPKKIDPLLLPHRDAEVRVAPGVEIAEKARQSALPVVKLHEDDEVHSELEKDIRFSTTLHEVPALKGLEITKLEAGARHSIALLRDGRVCGFGSNDYGQLGLGPSLSYPCIPTPTEIPLQASYLKTVRVLCKNVAAGGNLTYFVVEQQPIPHGRMTFDLLATGNGQFGGIGNGTWAHTASPVKVRTVSGLVEWNDEKQRPEPIPIRSVSAGKTHAAIVLDNAVDQGAVKFGRDVYMLGHNEFYQLGTGRRSNLATPQHLAPLPYPGLTPPPALTEDDPKGVSSGTLSPMPHSRMQLAPEIKVKGKRVEETIVCGDHSTCVYWRILNP
ncbi:RCC1/BLIP-II [Meredithblackwellia eburnea MCA 4105]